MYVYHVHTKISLYKGKSTKFSKGRGKNLVATSDVVKEADSYKKGADIFNSTYSNVTRKKSLDFRSYLLGCLLTSLFYITLNLLEKWQILNF